ncbi:MAG: hypothetical protein PHT59_00995, partial [Candidatus Omnitrophica bacterium]|nr:hypothetical protein [Candidatus Omnitrophota bacterium]
MTWAKVGTINNVDVEYSTNAFDDELQVFPIVGNASGNSTSWSIPDKIGDRVKVRVKVTGDASVFAVSPSTFKIIGSLTLISPNGAQNWISGSSHDIQWQTRGNITEVKLEFCGNFGSGDTWQEIITDLANPLRYPATGSYTWSFPSIISNKCRVRVSDAADPDAISTSAANFTLRGDLHITVPNDGTEKWAVGTSKLIEWGTTGPVQYVGLEYSVNAGSQYIPIIASTPNSGKFTWAIPNDTPLTSQALIK